MIDGQDLYGDLDNGAWLSTDRREDSEWQALEQENSKLKSEIVNLQEENQSLALQLTEYKTKITNAEVNFEILKQTYTQDIERKERQVQDARKDRDDVIFRRKKQRDLKDRWTMTNIVETIDQKIQTDSDNNHIIAKREELDLRDRLRKLSNGHTRQRSPNKKSLKSPIRSSNRKRERSPPKRESDRDRKRSRRESDKSRSDYRSTRRQESHRTKSPSSRLRPRSKTPKSRSNTPLSRVIVADKKTIKVERAFETVSEQKSVTGLETKHTELKPDPILLKKATKSGEFKALEYLWEEREQEKVPEDSRDDSLLICPASTTLVTKPLKISSGDTTETATMIPQPSSDNTSSNTVQKGDKKIQIEDIEEGEIVDESTTGSTLHQTVGPKTQNAVTRLENVVQQLIDESACDFPPPEFSRVVKSSVDMLMRQPSREQAEKIEIKPVEKQLTVKNVETNEVKNKEQGPIAKRTRCRSSTLNESKGSVTNSEPSIPTPVVSSNPVDPSPSNKPPQTSPQLTITETPPLAQSQHTLMDEPENTSNESLKENTPSFVVNVHRAGKVSTPICSGKSGEPKQLVTDFNNSSHELSSIRGVSNENLVDSKVEEEKSVGNSSAGKIIVTKERIYEIGETESNYVITITRKKKKKKGDKQRKEQSST